MNNQNQQKTQPKPQPNPLPEPQPNCPSKVPHHPSGTGRDNNPPKSATMILTKKK